MLEQARRYQAQVTGAPEGYVYRVKLGDKYVKFDGFDQGVLLETKATGYAQWIDKNLNFLRIFKGRDQMLDQAQRQFRAANGTPVRWIVAEEKLAGALRKMFREARLDIEVIHVPSTP
jgi:NADPH-dependent ferric siderophore reductase